MKSCYLAKKMGTETLAELEKAAQEIRDGLKNVNEDIKKLTGRDPSDNSTRYTNMIYLIYSVWLVMVVRNVN